VASGFAVELGDRDVDWVVATGDTAVRRRAGSQVLSAPHVVGDPRVETAAGPFLVSWTGGMPDAGGAGVGTWLTVEGRAGGPRTGFVVSAPGGASALTLYVGADGPDARVTVETGGRTRDVVPLPATAGGYVVTIRLGGGGDGQVTARVDAAGGGLVAFAAAVLR
jgi:hypothetical protein